MVGSPSPTSPWTDSDIIFLMLNPPNAGPEGGTTRVLFLDDMESRHSEFMRVVGMREGLEIHRAWTAEEAISLLRERRFDQAFLDHDLSEVDVTCRVADATRAPTGMAVVEHILSMEDPPSQVVIHSCNAPAAALMHVRLDGHPAGIRVSRVPFPFLLQAIR